MAERFGYGDYIYELDPEWGRLPDGWSYVDASGVAVDDEDRVYVFNRGTHPVVVFDRSGRLLSAWGDGVFKNPHGIHFARSGDSGGVLYCVDNGDHTVRKCSLDGRVLFTLGTPGVPSETGKGEGGWDAIRGGPPFNGPTNAALSSHPSDLGSPDPSGDLYVTDGYGNCRVHRFAPDGTLKQSWGAAGGGPGQFRLPHGICIGPDGTIYAGDRQNSRVQRFSPSGDYLGEWSDVRRPDDLYYRDGVFYVAELGYPDERVKTDGLGARVTIRNASGAILSAWGDAGDPCAPGHCAAPHGIAVDSEGSLYLGEVTYTARVRRGLVPPTCHVFQKFVRVR